MFDVDMSPHLIKGWDNELSSDHGSETTRDVRAPPIQNRTQTTRAPSFSKKHRNHHHDHHQRKQSELKKKKEKKSKPYKAGIENKLISSGLAHGTCLAVTDPQEQGQFSQFNRRTVFVAERPRRMLSINRWSDD
jgi:hypothetical protein